MRGREKRRKERGREREMKMMIGNEVVKKSCRFEDCSRKSSSFIEGEDRKITCQEVPKNLGDKKSRGKIRKKEGRGRMR